MNQLSYYGKTDSGCCRENNEDAYHLEQKGRYVIAVVADGIGGYDGGEIASYLACKCISDYLWNTPKKDFGSDVLKEMEQHLACMCYVGATRLYKYRDVMLEKLSKDHLLAGFQEEEKIILQQLYWKTSKYTIES